MMESAFVLMRLGSDTGDDWRPVGVYRTRHAAVEAYRAAAPHDEDVEMYTVEFLVGAPLEVDAMEDRGVAV